jgi:sugar transferase (PEP-CTERM system associated)
MFRLFHNRSSAAALLEVLFDATLGFAAALAAAASLHALWEGGSLNLSVVVVAIAFAVIMSLLQSFVGLYRHDRIGLSSILARLALVVGIGGYGLYLGLKQLGVEGEPAKLVGMATAYFVVGVVSIRGLVMLCRDAMGASRVLIVGTGTEARNVFDDIAQRGGGACQVVGFYEAGMAENQVAARATVFPRSQNLSEVVAKLGVDEIIVAAREQRGGAMPMEELLTCRTNGIKVMDAAGFYERSHAEIPLESLKASFLIYGDGFVQGTARRLAKRSFDIVVSATLLLLALPVMILTAIAIKLDSPGPVVYRQERVGQGGRRFWCLKLRSMRTDAEKDGVARWASKNDSRVTRVGAFIRKTRIDELPQLISVLRGEMSMVGPRPERPSFVEQLREQIPFYDLRHTIKPGVTGWAQVRYAYGASVEDARRKHQFDLYYVKNNSIWLDIIVLIETVAVVLFREGAQ